LPVVVLNSKNEFDRGQIKEVTLTPLKIKIYLIDQDRYTFHENVKNIHSLDCRFCFPPIIYEVAIDGVKFGEVDGVKNESYSEIGSYVMPVVNQFFINCDKGAIFSGMFFYNKQTIYANSVRNINNDHLQEMLATYALMEIVPTRCKVYRKELEKKKNISTTPRSLIPSRTPTKKKEDSKSVNYQTANPINQNDSLNEKLDKYLQSMETNEAEIVVAADASSVSSATPVPPPSSMSQPPDSGEYNTTIASTAAENVEPKSSDPDYVASLPVFPDPRPSSPDVLSQISTRSSRRTSKRGKRAVIDVIRNMKNAQKKKNNSS
jgi:hypothetical protein